MSKRVTIGDLAEKLNLSKTLVSMVLSGKGDRYNISKATQARVLALAKELNYRPNMSARSLRTGRTDSIGLIVPDISNSFYARIARVLENELEKENKRLFICSSDEQPERETELVEFLVDRDIDGVITATCLDSPAYYEELSKQGVKTVLIDRVFSGTELPSVAVDNLESTERAVQRMIDAGKKNIALLTLTPAHISPLKHRSEGFEKAMKAAGLGPDPEFMIEVPHSNPEGPIKDKVGALLDKHQVDAFFVTNNMLAVHLFKFLKERGVDVPGTISLISFDDIPLFALTEPPITAIAQPVDDIAIRASELLLSMINNDSEGMPDSVVLSTAYVERNTL